MSGEKKTSREWYKAQDALRIIDADGWRGADGIGYFENVLITEAEFNERLMQCTVEQVLK